MRHVVTDNTEESRFEVRQDGVLAGFAAYTRRPGVVAFTHTEVDPAFEGQGLGGILVGAALDAAREAGAEVLPFCPFVRGYIAKHRGEYLDLVPEVRRGQFDLKDG